ncbi:MAG: ATP-binding cassette domain-containing protein [Betaproteobacteria bacterium]|nr:ATP-binding cassette domain-containing protein [Betaproteobacteria bacterium]
MNSLSAEVSLQANVAFEVKSISKHFTGMKRPAVDSVSMRLKEGEIVALLGASGSGKSTLIRLICGLERCDRDSGEVHTPLGVLQAKGVLSRQIRRLRQQFAVIFQQFNLVGRLDVMTNALSMVGLADQAFQRASTLSGGQQQRAAVARALLQGAKVLLADEPVASLDPESSKRVMDSMTSLCQAHGMTLLVSLHQVHVAKQYCPRIIAMREGQVLLDANQDAFDEAFLSQLYRQQPEEAL